jgi:hypothetical protein
MASIDHLPPHVLTLSEETYWRNVTSASKGRKRESGIRVCFCSDRIITLRYHCIEEFYRLGYNAGSLLKVNRRFGGTCHLHLQGRRISQARNQRESSCLPRVPPKRRLTFNGLHSVISQKIKLFITTVLITSNPTSLHWDFLYKENTGWQGFTLFL